MKERWYVLAVKAYVTGAIDYAKFDPLNLRDKLKERAVFYQLEGELIAQSYERMITIGAAALAVDAEPERQFRKLVSLHNSIDGILLPWMAQDEWRETAGMVKRTLRLLRNPEIRRQLIENQREMEQRAEKRRSELENDRRIVQIISQLSN